MGKELHTPAFDAWYALFQVQARTLELIGDELERRTGLPVAWYELLVYVAGCEEEGVRMNELAEWLLISRGGATKLVARLEEAGLVHRVTPPSDRRATFARITPEGLELAQRAMPVQLALVEETFGQFLDGEELAVITRACRKVLTGIGAPCDFLDGNDAPGAATPGSAHAPVAAEPGAGA